MPKLAPNQAELNRIKKMVREGGTAAGIAKVLNIEETPIKTWVAHFKEVLKEEAAELKKAAAEEAKEAKVLTVAQSKKLKEEIDELEKQVEENEATIEKLEAEVKALKDSLKAVEPVPPEKKAEEKPKGK